MTSNGAYKSIKREDPAPRHGTAHHYNPLPFARQYGPFVQKKTPRISMAKAGSWPMLSVRCQGVVRSRSVLAALFAGRAWTLRLLQLGLADEGIVAIRGRRRHLPIVLVDVGLSRPEIRGRSRRVGLRCRAAGRQQTSGHDEENGAFHWHSPPLPSYERRRTGRGYILSRLGRSHSATGIG